MSSLIEQFGLDPDDIRWADLAFCQNPDQAGLFFERYERDPILAKQVDEICLHCPVRRQCYREGVEGKRDGVWGGVYLDAGNVDKTKNAHKTDEVWDRLNG